MKRFSKQTLALLAVSAVAVIAVLGAYAYWTTSGSGSGTASAAANNANSLAISGGSSVALAPNTSDEFTITVANSNAGSAYADNLYVSISNNKTGCDSGWFKVDNANATSPDNVVSFNKTVAAGGSDTAAAEIWFNDSASNQDACKGAAITLTYSTTAPTS